MFMGCTLQICAMEHGSDQDLSSLPVSTKIILSDAQSSQERKDLRGMPTEYTDYLKYLTQETRKKVNNRLPHTLPTTKLAKRSSAKDRFHNRRKKGFAQIPEIFPEEEKPTYTLPTPRNTKLSWEDMKKAMDHFHNLCDLSPYFAEKAQQRGGYFTLVKTDNGYKKVGHDGYN